MGACTSRSLCTPQAGVMQYSYRGHSLPAVTFSYSCCPSTPSNKDEREVLPHPGVVDKAAQKQAGKRGGRKPAPQRPGHNSHPRPHPT